MGEGTEAHVTRSLANSVKVAVKNFTWRADCFSSSARFTPHTYVINTSSTRHHGASSSSSQNSG